MELTVKKVIQGSTVILTLNGILDISTTNLIDPYLEELENIDLLIFDFSELDFIDSTGIGSIMNAIYLSQEQKFKVQLRGVNELTHEVLEMVGLFQILQAFQGEVV
jgi:anti-anti-sigma factor